MIAEPHALPMAEMLQQHLPVLVILLPLFGGVLATFTGRGLFPWLWATIVTGATLGTSLLLLEQVHAAADGIVSYPLGSWKAAYGIEYRVDALNSYVLVVVSTLAFLATIYAKVSVADEIPKDRHNFFYSVWLLAIAGLLGITVTGDTFNIYVLLEISSLTVYALVALGKDRNPRALTAAIKYLILGSVGATFLLLGIGYLLMLTGTLNLADMHVQLEAMRQAGDTEVNRTIYVAVAFLMVGLSLKMALFPLHTWLPNAYAYAPSAVSALIASTATKVGVYLAFRFIFTLLGNTYDTLHDLDVFVGCACLGIVISAISAAQQNNIKRMLAFSSVGQLAYIVLGFSLGNETGLTAALIHIFNHAITKGAMFMAIGAVVYRVGGCNLTHLAGLGRKMPLTMASFFLGGLGLIGMPLTAGFVSKWYLVQSALQEGYWWIAFIVLIGSLLALIYIWRVVEVIYFKPCTHDGEIKEAPLSMQIPMWTLTIASLYFGINATQTSELARAGAKLLMGGLF